MVTTENATIWPETESEWPADSDTCLMCEQVIEPGEEVFVVSDYSTTAAVHARCAQ